MELVYQGPTIKQQLKDLLYGFLYTQVNQQFVERLQAITTRHRQLSNSAQPYFLFRGEVYCGDPTVQRDGRIRQLVRGLHPDMDEYVKELKELNDYEIPMVLGFFTNMLNASNDVQDYLRILPESMHTAFDDWLTVYPSTSTTLTDAQIAEIQARNALPIKLLKGRLFLNLLF